MISNGFKIVPFCLMIFFVIFYSVFKLSIGFFFCVRHNPGSLNGCKLKIAKTLPSPELKIAVEKYTFHSSGRRRKIEKKDKRAVVR